MIFTYKYSNKFFILWKNFALVATLIIYMDTCEYIQKVR